MADMFEELDNFDFPDEWGDDARAQPPETPDISTIATTLKKRAMVVIFVVDTSGSMRNERIGAVNNAIRDVLPELRRREHSNTAAEIKVAIMRFSTKAEWVTEDPEPVADFVYDDITDVHGGTSYGKAYAELNDKLSAKKFMKSSAGTYTPLIVLMSDGLPSDMSVYHEELAKLQKNPWFRHATRAGIMIEAGADAELCRKTLTEFTGNPKNVYDAADAGLLTKQIQLVTLTGVDVVTQQGSVQNTGQRVAKLSAFGSSDSLDAPAPLESAAAPETASATILLDDVDWDEFD